ncbi:MAG: trehalose-phosphatase [Phyllobacteriaceae bacterium]|nr:trehalose-phosphatase [Phyllobacteriaceae bacterium]
MTIPSMLARPHEPPRADLSAERTALFLDLDGTLIDIAATAESVEVPRSLAGLLEDLSDALDGALAILTGRPIADVDRLLAPSRFVAAGIHGAEYRTSPDDGVRHAALPLADAFVARLKGLETRFPGVRVEDKGPTAAVHWRAAPTVADELEREVERLLEGAPDHLEIRHGRRVFEIVPRHVSKGAALEILSGLDRFAGRRPIMIGDDLTDETAMAAAERLGGVGFRVEGETFPAEVADFASPRQVRAWLSDFLRRVGR